MAGNSWLAGSQWFVAAERPPHLAYIAPFKGQSDHLRETLCRGGIPTTTFSNMIQNVLAGRLFILFRLREFPLNVRVQDEVDRRTMCPCSKSIPTAGNTGMTSGLAWTGSKCQRTYLPASLRCFTRSEASDDLKRFHTRPSGML